MATARRFVQNAAMTAIAIGFRNPDVAYIADMVMPRVPVPTETFKWLRYVDAEAFTLPSTRVGRKGKVNEVEFSATEESGSVETYGLQSVIPKSDIDAAAAQRAAGLTTYDPRNFTTAMLANLMMLDREIRVAAAVQATGNYDAANVTNLASAGDRFDSATGDAEAVIDAALNGTFIVRPNTAVFPEPVWQKLRKNPLLVKAVKGTTQGAGKITQEEFKAYFELQNLYVGAAYANSAKPGQTPTMARVWGKTAAFLFLDRMARPEGGVTWGYSPTWGDRVAGTLPDEDVGLDGGEAIRVGERIAELVVCKSAGALITNAIS